MATEPIPKEPVWGFAATAGMPGFFNGNFDFQFARTLGCASDGGAALGECFETAKRVTNGDFESWTTAWSETGQRVEDIARACLDKGRRVSAREAFLRASSYWRSAGFFLHQSDSRCLTTWESQRNCFREAAALMDTPVEIVAIPYEGGATLPGYFLKPSDDDRARPTLLCLGGGDTTGEELYFWGNGASATRRGYNALLFEIPGQRGAMYTDSRLHYRPDAEAPLGWVCDWVTERADVNPEQLALIGHSFGGYFAPRAAAFEKRLSACIASPTLPALIMNFLGMLGLPLDEPYEQILEQQIDMEDTLHKFILESDFRWRMGVGDGTIADLLKAAEDYSLWGLEDEITCHYLNMVGEGDERKMIEAQRFFEVLKCPKAEHVVREIDGGEAHCGVNNPALKQQIEFDWLDEVFGT